MTNNGTCILNFDLNGKNQRIQPLVISHLGYSLILGLDFIKHFAYRASDSFVMLNDMKIPRFNTIASQAKPVNNMMITIPPALEHIVHVQNPIFNQPVNEILVAQHDKAADSSLIVNTSTYSNKQFIPLSITNLSNSDISVPDIRKLVHFEPITNPTAAINGLIVMGDETEAVDQQRFQLDREDKFFPAGFTPEMGPIGSHLTQLQSEEIKSLLYNRRLAFSANDEDLGCLHYRFTMPLMNENDTAYEPARPVPYGLQDKVTCQLNTWKNRGMINVASSRHNIPLLIIRKPDGTVRTSLDARKLNKLLIPDRFPLPNLREVIHQIGRRIKCGQNVFITQLDLSKGYWQLRTTEADKEKLAFSFRNEQFVSNRALYGIATIPTAFCRMVHSVFGKVSDAFIYLDDIAVVRTNWQDHMAALDEIFDLAIKHGLNLSGKKSRFACSSMNFLGYRIDKMGIRSSINHVDKIVNYPRPSTSAELKRWLGICAYTSRMVENASVILAPLHKTCSPKSEFKWNNDDQAAFDLFKTKLAESSGLHHRDETLPLVLCTDASLNKFGAILYQGQLGSLQPLAYHSGLFTAAERRISSRHRELLAITFSIRRFEYDLIGQTFVVITDHRSLVNLLTAKSRNELNLKLVNCLYYLFQFDFSVSYAAGESNIMKASDALSRTPISKADILELAERNEIPEKVFFLNTLPSTLENETQKTRYYLRSVSKIIQEENNELHGPAQPHKLDELTAHVIRIADKTFSKDEIVRLQRQCRTVFHYVTQGGQKNSKF